MGNRGRTKLIPVVVAILIVGGCAQFVDGLFDSGEMVTPTSSQPATDVAEPSTSGVTESPTGAPTPAETPAETASATEPGSPTQASGEARQALDGLRIKGRAPKTGYDRDLFSDGWGSLNGCDWRNRILTRDLIQKTYRDDCIVQSGILQDPYTGKTIEFLRGVQTSNAVQIDHVVAVSDAWQKGAQQLDAQARYRFYNDPLNLLAVDGPINAQKGDSDAASWLPPNKAFRCQYVARQVAVKAKYQLWVTQAEYDAIARVLSACPSQALPD